jgi:hypothetical protein
VIGKILDKRYVILEPTGEGDGVYLAYDMNNLARLKLRLEPDDAGKPGSQGYTILEVRPAAPGAAPGRPPAIPPPPPPDDEPEPPPGPSLRRRKKPTTQPFSVITVLPSSSPGEPAEPVQGPQPPVLLQNTGSAPPPRSTRDSGSLPRSDPTRGLGTRPPLRGRSTLVEALEKALQGTSSGGADPLGTTQELDLDSPEVLEQQPLVIEPRAPARATPPGTTRRRPQTSKIEAAWFAMGEGMEEDEEADPASITQTTLKQAELERQAYSLSSDIYRQFALDLTPPSAPRPIPRTPSPPPSPPSLDVPGNPSGSVAGEIRAPGALPRQPDPTPVPGGFAIEPRASQPRTPAITTSTQSSHHPPRSDLERALPGRLGRLVRTRAGSFALGLAAGLLLGVLLTLLLV